MSRTIRGRAGEGTTPPVAGVWPTAPPPPFIHRLSSSLLRLSLLSSGCAECSVVPILLCACPLCSLTALLHDNTGLVRDEGVPVPRSPCPTPRVYDGAQTSPQHKSGPQHRDWLVIGSTCLLWLWLIRFTSLCGFPTTPAE